MIREICRWTVQELIEAEAAAKIGAGRYQRNDDRIAERNGHRPRVLSTKTGDLNLGIPKLRKGTFYPSTASISIERFMAKLIRTLRTV